ncbi:MAG: hypothetical protein ACREP0_03545 [Rhodanobacteraceae bacterium]
MGAAAMAAGGAQAGQPVALTAVRTASAPFGTAPVGDSRLAAVRGGFDLGNGLVASFGITRAVYVNGNLVASISVNIPNLAQIDGAQANALAALANDVTVIRNGPGNFADPASFNQATGALIIQNSLDGQQIRALTTLDTTVRNLAQFSSLNIGNTLQQALVNSRGQ